MPTQVTYTATAAQTDFTIPFPFLRDTDIKVYIQASGSGPFTQTTAFTVPDTGTMRLNSGASAGDKVRIARSTAVDSPIVDFTDPADLTSDNLDQAVAQPRYKVEELQLAVNSLDLTLSAAVPGATAADQWLVSAPDGLGGWDWEVTSLAAAQALLGGAGGLPSPLSGNQFLITNLSTSTWELATIAQVKTLLGISASAPTVPSPSGNPNSFLTTNSGGTAYQLSTVADARTLLGLGSAAYVNTGTAAGNAVILQAGSTYGALPTIEKGGLVGVASTPDFASFTIGYSAGSVSVSAGATATFNGTATAAVNPVDGAWVSYSTNEITLDQGRYLVEAIETTGNTMAAGFALQLDATTGTASPDPVDGWETTGGRRMKHMLRVTSSSATFQVKAKNTTGGSLSFATGPTTYTARFFVTKVE